VDIAGRLVSIGQRVQEIDHIQGQYIGLVSFRAAGLNVACDLARQERAANIRGEFLIREDRPFSKLFMTDFLQGLINHGAEVWPAWVEGGWIEIDTLSDLDLASRLSTLKGSGLTILR
jgi:choline kinase